MKVLSFIIPAYNSEQFLDKCITSLLCDSCLLETEIIIVNDGSTDGTEAVALKYCERYPDAVRLISQENKGHGGAINTGAAAATGKYLKVIDADDWVETENLPAFINFLKSSNSDVVLTHHYTVNISTGEKRKWMSYPNVFSKALSFEEVVSCFGDFDRSITFHGITYRTEFYQRCATPLTEKVFYEDHEFSTFPFCFCRTVTPLDLFIYCYRIGDIEQSVSDQNQLKRIDHTEKVLNRFINEYKSLPSDAPEATKEFISLKAKILLLSYIKTVLLVEKNKKQGRLKAAEMMTLIKSEMPRVWELSQSQYKAFKMLNFLHISKQAVENILSSRVYHILKGDHNFN